ncbi:CidA/LrgA family protein [Pseudogemmobacter humi]|uniref:Holin-like protein CidA n=1 Tax=Pseudogemmobacter humi TaxID=2483812 RepID=A0A3P5XSI5_9RHOB|nr:CidA/LrgA family protein [Pseudogemmobacter humi]VDC33764.1 Holin-like protein CidA [Pseudogemmobacter humi]
MTARHRTARFLHHHPAAQVLTVFAFWLLGEAVTRLGGIPLPGGIIGLGLLLFLLIMRRISSLSIRRGAGWFLSDMLLFFVPAVLAVLDHPELFGLTGLKILFVILTSTALVMLATAFTVDRCWKYLGHREASGHA